MRTGRRFHHPGRDRPQRRPGLAVTLNRRDPRLFEAQYYYARHTFVLGRLEKAAAESEAAIQLRPDDCQAPLLVAQIYDDPGRAGDAGAARLLGIAAAEEHLRLNPDDARAAYRAANGMAVLGQRESSREWARRAFAMRPTDSMLLYNFDYIYALPGFDDDALYAVEQAVHHGLRQRGWFEHDSNLRFRPCPSALPRPAWATPARGFRSIKKR